MRYLHLELFFITVLIPLTLYIFDGVRYGLGSLWVLFFVAVVYLRRKPGFSWRQEWNAAALTWVNLWPVLARFALAVIIMTAFTYFYNPERLFGFISRMPWQWAMVMLLYPILSVIPQELIFRSFLYQRYAPILGQGVAMAVVSGFAFGFAHILFNNWVAVVFSFIGGVIFAYTYHRHRSLSLVVLEHSLYGQWLFTCGLGWYFYHGSAG